MKTIKWDITLGVVPETPGGTYSSHADELMLLGRVDTEQLTVGFVRYRLINLKRSLQWLRVLKNSVL